jgi:hypothetical protein
VVLDPLRRAFGVWQQVGAPYLAARLRVLLARACIALGDVEGARLELEGAREVFAALGARPDLAEVDAIGASLGRNRKGAANRHGLTAREVDRHVSNIFMKLDVSSRAAATAFAYEHQLI